MLSPAEEAPQPHLQSIESAIQAASFSSRPISVVVRGIVTSNHRQIVIEDRTGAAKVITLQSETIALGDEVEVTGEMTVAPEPQIREGRIRRLWGGSMPLPLSITPDQAADGENDLFLVQTTAELMSFTPAGLTGVRLNLRGGHQNFSAVLPSDGLGGELPTTTLQPGATLRLTGILEVNHGTDAGNGDAFTMQLRTLDDIEVVEPPSWWTRAHILMLTGVATILILIGIISYYRIKHDRYRAVAEERASIARDIHDTLAQGYAGITLQLEAAQQVIGRDSARAEALLSEALQLVRHSRDESHLSIDILRALSRNDRLDMLISRCIQQLRSVSETPIEQQVHGVPGAFSYKMVNNLFRIVQEALVNAVNHAQANKILVRVEYHKSEVVVEVRDNGRGFNPEGAPGPQEGHFGLLGMRERCAAINGELELQSTSKGTMVRVRAAA
ncbi:MAG TPA: sensor histidine kinase [Terracidiphilus sp.]|nr:sensor histidine kinase [Terracidiphilus sp.]